MLRLLVVAAVTTAGLVSHAQSVVGSGTPTPVKDSSMLKPPAGVKVAVIEWEDLECPACAHAFPIVHQVANQYHVPVVQYDFQIPGHIWSHPASLYARYLEDNVSPTLATEYRREVFATQYKIASQDDLMAFTRKFFADHNQQMPFALDPKFEREVTADRDLGLRMGLLHTPTIFVVTAHHWIEVTEVDSLGQALSQAEASVRETSRRR